MKTPFVFWLCNPVAKPPKLTRIGLVHRALGKVRHDFAGDFDHKQRWIFLQCCEVPLETSWMLLTLLVSEWIEIGEALRFY